jgi:hypothetical protein
MRLAAPFDGRAEGEEVAAIRGAKVGVSGR